MTRHINSAGLSLLKLFEGLKLKAYPDPATGGDPWTIGYGHTSGVKRGQVITEATADAYLRADVQWAEAAVLRNVKVALTDNQFSALVVFVFNIGEGAFSKSTLLKKLNAADYPGAAAEFLKWNRAGGKVMAGLTRRRGAEKALFERK